MKTEALPKLSHWTKIYAESRGLKVWHQPATTSTNDEAKANHKFDLFLTDHQTSGRGRGTNLWQDQSGGANLLSSWCYQLASPAQHISGAVWGLAIYRAAKKTWPENKWSLKAPNDLLLNGKKIAGLLLESVSQGTSHRLVVGLGFNAAMAPESMAQATHLPQPPDEIEWQTWLANLISCFSLAKKSCQKTTLGQDDCAELLVAVNANPNLDTKYIKIDCNGSLHLVDKTLSWNEI